MRSTPILFGLAHVPYLFLELEQQPVFGSLRTEEELRSRRPEGLERVRCCVIVDSLRPS